MLMVRYISATRVNTLVFLKVEEAISLPCSASSATVIVEQGPAKSVLNQPQHARTQDFLRRVLHPL